jgi:hypothetical protein
VHVVDQDGQRRRGTAQRQLQATGRATGGAAGADLAVVAISAAGSNPRRRRRAGSAGTGTSGAALARSGAGRFAAIWAAIRSATGSAERNFSAPTSSRATPS